MKKEKYIINEEEIALLESVEGIDRDPVEYDDFPAASLAMFCRMKDRSNDIFVRRYTAAREVIDLIAETVGIDPENCSFWLYTLEADGTSPIVSRMESWLSRSGEKAQLKKRIMELEQENALLTKLLKS